MLTWLRVETDIQLQFMIPRQKFGMIYNRHTNIVQRRTSTHAHTHTHTPHVHTVQSVADSRRSIRNQYNRGKALWRTSGGSLWGQGPGAQGLCPLQPRTINTTRGPPFPPAFPIYHLFGVSKESQFKAGLLHRVYTAAGKHPTHWTPKHPLCVHGASKVSVGRAPGQEETGKTVRHRNLQGIEMIGAGLFFPMFACLFGARLTGWLGAANEG